MSVRILHAADFHMDSPFLSLPREKAVQRRREQRELLHRLTDTARNERVQIVLLAGDLFDSGVSYWETMETLTEALSGLEAQVFIAPGNHDYYTSRSPYAFMKLPDNIHVFKSPSPRCVELPELHCRVWGAGFTASTCDGLLERFHSGPTGDMVELMVLHGDLSGKRYNPITEEQIASSGLDYLALGHQHAFSGIKKAGGTFYAYSGCLEGRGFDETGQKGVIVGTVDKGSCDLHFLPVAGRQYLVREIDLTGVENAEAAVMSAAGSGDPDNIVRLILSGQYDGVIDTEHLHALLDDKYYDLTLLNQTKPRREVWSGAGDDSLTGLFLARMKARFDNALDDEERQKCLLAAKYGLAALEGREEWQP